MYLKRLEIQGFKTFAQRAVFEFQPGVTAIVGPNGSGKSNVADAVRWVLGEQSYAALRCKRTEELLFSGGGRRAPAGLAEVSLIIDNSDRLLPLAFDEVAITRRATRTGDNEYFINRNRVRLRDVQAAVASLGGSYTIINQGLVDAALTLRPEERRRLFEDAAEIGGFEMRKNEALRRLRETDANLQRLSDLLGELEPRLRSLKRQATQARQQRQLNDELRDLLTRSYAAQWRAARAELIRAEQADEQLAAELERARATQASVAVELRATREESRARREHLGQLHQRGSSLHTRAEVIQRELAVAEERLAALNRRAEDLERNRQDLELRRSEAERELTAAEAELAAAEAELAERQTRLAGCQTEITAAEAARRELTRMINDAQDASLQASAAIVELRTRAEQLAAQRERLQKEQIELDAALAQADTRLNAAREQVDAARTALTAAEDQHAAAEEALTAARTELDDLRSNRAAADEELAAARRTHADAEARLETLSRLARSHAGTFAGVKAALQWAERTGRIDFALVSSIIRTPAELETAIEVALGSRLQNIVVETWRDAEDAIAELKRGGQGRATFLPLDTLKNTSRGGSSEAHKTRTDAILGVAADLVEYDERYRAVVEYLLGRTRVVRDLAVAREELRRLSGGWTIVTLAGEQVITGGAVTGGAATKESGTLRRERDLRELPERVAAAQRAIQQAEERKRNLEAQLEAATNVLRAGEARLREAVRQNDATRAALDSASRRTAQAEQERTWQQQRRETVMRDSAALEQPALDLESRRIAAEENAVAAQQRLDTLRARQASESEADRAAQEHFANLRTAVAGAESQVKAQRTLIATHRQNLQRLVAQAGQADQVGERLVSERDQLRADHDRFAASHHALLAEIDALRAEIDPAEAELEADESRLVALEQRETEATATLLGREGASNRAALDSQRARDRLESVFERAAAEQIDPTQTKAESPDADAPSADDIAALQASIQTLRDRITRLGIVNPLALEEYEQTAERQHFLSAQLDDLRQARETLEELISELDAAMHDRFTATFSAVAAEFERQFTRLFGGGTARLNLVGGARNGIEDAASAAETTTPAANGRTVGVEISARPPGKRQQNISLLSGGERALTASALLFAILTVNPSPFCILDEVDAALDESNVGRFRAALDDLTRRTQFLLITHNRGTIEAADTLYGITMGDDSASRVLSLRIAEDHSR